MLRRRPCLAESPDRGHPDKPVVVSELRRQCPDVRCRGCMAQSAEGLAGGPSPLPVCTLQQSSHRGCHLVEVLLRRPCLAESPDREHPDMLVVVSELPCTLR